MVKGLDCLYNTMIPLSAHFSLKGVKNSTESTKLKSSLFFRVTWASQDQCFILLSNFMKIKLNMDQSMLCVMSYLVLGMTSMAPIKMTVLALDDFERNLANLTESHTSSRFIHQ